MDELYAALANLAGQRVYPMVAPHGVQAPFVVYQSIAQEEIRGLNGSHDLTRYRVQVDCYAKTYKEAQTLSMSVRNAMDSSFEALASVNVAIEDFEETTRLYRVGLDFIYHA